jgi:hypothetical protein
VRVAHFVDAQGDQPVGVRAVEPPPDTRQALRGNLYAIVELTGDNPSRNELSERTLSAIQRTYYTAKGSQADVLAAAVASAQQKVDEFNEFHADQPLKAGIICVGLLNSHLLMLHSGPALALIGVGKAVDRYPADILNFDNADGEAPAPQFYRQHIENGASLFLGGAEWLDEVPIRTLAATVAYINIANCGEAARGLREQYEIEDLPGIFVVIEPVGGPIANVGDATRTAPTSDTSRTRPPADSGRSAAPGLPTAVNATPPVRGVPATSAPPPDAGPSVMDATAPRPSAAAQVTAALPPVGPPAAAGETDMAAPRDDAAGATLSGMAAGLASGAQSGARKTRDFFANILPDRMATPTAPPEEAPSHFEQALAEAQRQELRAPEPARGGRARLFLLLAGLILLLVPVVVMAVSWGQGSSVRADAEARIDMANAQFIAAQDALDAGDGATGRQQLDAALSNLAEAEALVGTTPEISRIRAQIEADLQDVLQIRPLNALVAPLVRFPQDAMPSRVLNIDQDIYVLDTGRQFIERYRLDLNQEFVPDPAPQVILRAGDVIDGVTVGRLVDIAWQPAVAGVEDKPGLLVLDRNNQFFRYDPRVEGASFVPLGDPAALQIPNQIESYFGRTYVADEGTQEIVRYEPGGFDLTPAPWFAPETATNLTGLRRMSIDGDIWLLYPTGIVLRYNQGESVPFSIKGSVAQIGDPIDMAVAQQSDILYIADASSERIFAFDKNGNYLAQYIAPEEGQLANLRGLYLDDVAGKLFILTQSSLFQIPPPSE